MKLATVVCAFLCVGALAKPQTIHVHEGESIQAAIDSAHRGDTILVDAGIYDEQLTVKKPGLQLIGEGAQLVPPDLFKKNICTGEAGPGTNAGICVQGSGIFKAAYHSEHQKILAVKKAISNVTISGFQVSRFKGANVMVIGGQDTLISNNTLVDGATYGLLAVGSVRTVIQKNSVTSSTAENSSFIAMCMDDIGDPTCVDNTITNYAIGVCVETRDAIVQQNSVSSTCNGIFIDPSSDAQVTNNQIGTSFTQCGDFGSYGIVLDGCNGAMVHGNVVQGQSNDGPAAGIAVFDEHCPQLSPSCDQVNRTLEAFTNTVTRNTLRNNDLDIYVNTTGKFNKFKPNKCSTSIPSAICM